MAEALFQVTQRSGEKTWPIQRQESCLALTLAQEKFGTENTEE